MVPGPNDDVVGPSRHMPNYVTSIGIREYRKVQPVVADAFDRYECLFNRQIACGVTYGAVNYAFGDERDIERCLNSACHVHSLCSDGIPIDKSIYPVNTG